MEASWADNLLASQEDHNIDTEVPAVWHDHDGFFKDFSFIFSTLSCTRKISQDSVMMWKLQFV